LGSLPAPATPMMTLTPQPRWQHSSACRISPTSPTHSKESARASPRTKTQEPGASLPTARAELDIPDPCLERRRFALVDPRCAAIPRADAFIDQPGGGSKATRSRRSG
jgi:hypothetical protein